MTTEKIGLYVIRSEMGRGGMGVVYRAYDPRFHRDVALKVMFPQFSADPAFRARFEREARIIASLEHRAIVPVYDFGEEDGRLYLVMRYMTGGSLTKRLRHHPISAAQALVILERIATALDYAHTHGVVHRDLKPDNILFDDQGHAYLADFGLANWTDPELGRATLAHLTQHGQIMGTPAYMSPEQVIGNIPADGRSDVYALGIILYELLTGNRPYQADTAMRVAMMQVSDPVPRIRDARPDLPPVIESVILRAMAKRPEERFATAGEMFVSLRTALETAQRAAPETIVESIPAKAGVTDQEVRSRRLFPRWAFGSMAAIGLFVVILSIVALPGLIGQLSTPTSTPTLSILEQTLTQPVVEAHATEQPTISLAGQVEQTPPSPTASPTPPATATATATPTAQPIPSFSDTYFCLQPCLPGGGNGGVTFSSGVELLYVRWTYQNLQPGSRYERIWYNNDEEWAHYDCSWPGPSQGTEMITLTEPDGLRAGQWKVVTLVDGQLVQEAEVTLTGNHDFWLPAGDFDSCFDKQRLPGTSTRRPTQPMTGVAKRETNVLGHSANGIPIEAIHFGDGPNKIVLVGGLHAGYAPNTVRMAQHAAEYFLENPEAVPASVTLYIIYSMNPDSSYDPGQVQGRLNANGVDMNRNWDCAWSPDPVIEGQIRQGAGGSGPLSEPEAEAVATFIQEQRPVAVIFWEAQAFNGLVVPGICNGQSMVSNPLTATYGQASGYRWSIAEDIDLPAVQGDVTNWLDAEGIPAIAVLLPSFTRIDWEPNLAGIEAVLRTYGK